MSIGTPLFTFLKAPVPRILELVLELRYPWLNTLRLCGEFKRHYFGSKFFQLNRPLIRPLILTDISIELLDLSYV